MAEYSAPATLTTPGGTILFNRPGDSYHHDVDLCDGLDEQPTVRSVYRPKPRTHGANIYPSLYGPREVPLGGWVRQTTLSGRSAALDALSAALDSIMAVDGTYAWETSNGTKVIVVRCAIGNKSLGRWLKKYQFTLVSGTVAI